MDPHLISITVSVKSSVEKQKPLLLWTRAFIIGIKPFTIVGEAGEVDVKEESVR